MSLQEAIDQFLAELAHKRAGKTAHTYATSMHHLLDWADAHGLSAVAELTPERLMEFVKSLAERDLARATMRVYLAGASSFYKWCISQELVQFDLAEWTRLEMRMHDWRKGLTETKLPRLPNEVTVQGTVAAAQHPAPRFASTTQQRNRYDLIMLRDRALVESLRCTGARVSELCTLTRADLDPVRKQAQCSGKGRKDRMLRFDDRAWAALQKYLSLRDELLKANGNGQEPVFSRHDRRTGERVLPLSTNAVRTILKYLSKWGGVEHLTPHQFRHRFATRMLEATGDIAMVQKALGHASVATTQVYAQVADARLDEAYRNTEL